MHNLFSTRSLLSFRGRLRPQPKVILAQDIMSVKSTKNFEMKNFGKKLRNLRTRNGLSQRELGDILGVNHRHVGRMEQGERIPNAAMILKISRAFDVCIDKLMKDELELDDWNDLVKNYALYAKNMG